MHAQDLAEARRELQKLDITRATNETEAMAAMRPLGNLDGRLVGLVRFKGLTPWERHPEGDELLHVLEGEVEVTLLPETGPPERSTLRAGAVAFVPRNLWHRQSAAIDTTLLFVTPAVGTVNVWDDDPRATRSD